MHFCFCLVLVRCLVTVIVALHALLVLPGDPLTLASTLLQPVFELVRNESLLELVVLDVVVA